MQNMEVDIAKMPLGKLSQAQVQRGYDALVDIKKAITAGAPHRTLQNLSSTFYQV